jgi:hypothetical protein
MGEKIIKMILSSCDFDETLIQGHSKLYSSKVKEIENQFYFDKALTILNELHVIVEKLRLKRMFQDERF